MKKIVVITLCLFLLFNAVIINAGAEEQEKLLTVSGSFTVVSVADEAYVTIGVKTSNIDYKACQEENKTKMNDITNAIKTMGIEENYIKTTQYNSVPIYEYVKTDEYTGIYYNGTYYNKRILKEYQLTHMIRVMLTDVSLVGRLIDITVENGVNELNNVQFALSNPKQHELYLQALEGASARAKDKANILAQSFDLKGMKVKSINTDSYSPYSYNNYSYNSIAPASGGSGMINESMAEYTTITSGEMQVSATVNIIYTYE